MNIIFLGKKDCAAEMLQWTVRQGIGVSLVCADAAHAGKALLDAARELCIPAASMEEAEEYVLAHPGEVDLAVSYLFWRRIRKPLIEGPRYGCINFHPAILPDWKGTAGYNIAILNKLDEWGATAHYVDESFDTGPIIKKYTFSFDYRLETALSLEKKTQEIQKALYKSVMLDFRERGRLPAEAQTAGGGTYISRAQMLEMMKIDMDRLDGEDLDLKIRAFWFPPFSGAGFEHNGKFYTLVNDEILRSLGGEI